MIKAIRRKFNQEFTAGKHKAFLEDMNSKHPGAILFRVAETPIFVSKEFTQKMIGACEAIVDVITDKNFEYLTHDAIPKNESVPNENKYSHFITFDFGVCEDKKGELEPQLIEMQGFPSMFAYEVYHAEMIEKHFQIPANFDTYLNGYNKDSYLQLFKEIVVGNNEVENVVLLEIKPHDQKTRIDFYCTQDYLNIPVVCLTELIQDGKKLYYQKRQEDTDQKNL
jgi:hypothetical protein